jgi:hypothetical protein
MIAFLATFPALAGAALGIYLLHRIKQQNAKRGRAIYFDRDGQYIGSERFD